MILLAVVLAACTGQMSAVTNADLGSAGEAVSLCITMAGLIQKLIRAISPFLTFLLPRIP